MSDAEFLARIRDTADADGWVSTLDMVKALGYQEDDKQSVVVRLSWSRRYGFVSRDEKKRKEDDTPNEHYAKWRLTDFGNLAIDAKFNKAQLSTLQSTRPEQLWLVSQYLSDSYKTTEAPYAHLVRREMTVGFKTRH